MRTIERHFILTILLIFTLATTVDGQVIYIDGLAEVVIDEYPYIVPQKGKIAILPMDFSKYEVHEPAVIDRLKTHYIDSIHLVYTNYPRGMDFRQLNQNRLNKLFRLFPALEEQTNVQWRVFRQEGRDNTLAEAMRLFHGFVFIYNDKKPLVARPSDSASVAKRQRQVDSRFSRAIASRLQTPFNIEDETTRAVFERKAQGWKNIIIISDWTGSMYPYTLQLLKWTIDCNTRSHILGYVFFNDGDEKTAKQKEIGTTGGIYTTSDTRIFPLLSMMQKIMKKGDGGELEENDIEAILYAIDTFPTADEYILIADNVSHIRDLALKDKIDKPVRVVLAKLYNGKTPLPINEGYIELAIATGGSIHTQKDDFETIEALEKLRKLSRYYKKQLKSKQESAYWTEYR